MARFFLFLDDMSALEQIERLIEPTLTDMGYDLVRVLMQGKERRTLQIMAERQDEAGMTVDDCADISRAVSAILDVEDPISGAYTLEVSSPGLDRPLVRPRDFERYAGYETKVEMKMAIDGQRRFSGRLLGIEDDMVRMEVDGETVDLPFADILKAKLLLTDELLAEAMKAGGGQEEDI